MKYILLIYDNEQDWINMGEEQQSQMYGEYMKFSAEIRESGNYIAGSQLHPIASATSVRIRDGKQLVVDGPFAETKEQLGGYYLIEAKDLDEATAIAARVPSARIGTVEVRPLVEMASAAS